jgi:hypothetical protein
MRQSTRYLYFLYSFKLIYSAQVLRNLHRKIVISGGEKIGFTEV